MPANVEPHEAEAIRDLLGGASAKPAGEVLDRDFHNPRRLGSVELAEFTRQFQLQLPDVEARLAEILESSCPLEWGSISEINSRGLFAGSLGPFAGVVFEVLGQPAWVMWDNVAAINAVEKILGSAPDSTEPRRLSSVEVDVLAGILSSIADCALRSLNLEGSNLRVAQSLESLGSWRDATGEPDPHRLHIELPFQGPGESSSFQIYIPAPPHAGASRSAEALAVALPSHLARVALDVSVTLGGCEIMLNQLLALEEGDVIPLETRVGEYAILNVEGRPHARGTLGRQHKQVALRIEHLVQEPI